MKVKRIFLTITCIHIFFAAFPGIAFGNVKIAFSSNDLINSSLKSRLTEKRSDKEIGNPVGDTYTVTVTASPAEAGTLSGGGIYNYGNMVTLNATPKPGYSFANWTENGVSVSSVSTYTFSINSNRSITAVFTPFTYNILVSATPADAGTLSGGGIYDYGSNATLNATPRPRYSFVNWIENGIPVSTNSIYGFKVSASRTLFANFVSNTYSGIILASPIPLAGGTVSGGGTYSYGSFATLTATSNSGYSFNNWTENGIIVSTNLTYSFTIDRNRSLTANFTINTQTVTVSASPAEGGSASGGGTYVYGSSVILNATPNTGYNFVSWTENGTQVNTSSIYSIVLNTNRALVANFTNNSSFVVLASAIPSVGGTVSGNGSYTYGSAVTMNAMPVAGYSFVNWTENGTQLSSGSTYSFTINSNRSLVANFAPVTYSILASASPVTGGMVSGNGTYDYGSIASVTANPATGYSFNNWTEGGTVVSTNATFSFTVAGNRTLTADFSIITNTISATASPVEGGSVSGTGTYNSGSVVTVSAAPVIGYNFVNWTENGTQVSTGLTYSFTINGNRTIVANFTLNPNTCSIQTSAIPSAGGSVSSNRTYTIGSIASLTATPFTGYSFTSWTENGTVVGTNPLLSFTVVGSRILIANFTINKYNTLVTSLPDAGGSASGGGTYNYGSSVTLNATPGTGYSFINWTENGVVVSTSSAYSFTIISNKTLVANFTLNPDTYSIQALVAPLSGGTVSGSKTYTLGSIATLIAAPASGYSFINWTEGNTIVSTNPTYNFAVGGSSTLTANFSLNSYSVSVTASPASSGTVGGGGTYTYGSTVTLNAAAGNGYNFVNWTENGTPVSTAATYKFAADANRTLEATFTLNKYSILASATPSAGGSTVGSATYDFGSVATLTATPDTGYSFTGWTENGIFVSSNAIYSFNVNGNRTLIADFKLKTNTISVTASPAAGGSAGGTGTYDYGNVITLYAIPKIGFSFVNWTENGILVSTSSTFSFVINTDRTLVANYTPVTYAITAAALPFEGGSVSGGKTYNYGSVVIITAAPGSGYSFTNWTENGTIVSIDSAYSFTVEGSKSLTANFSINKHMISITAFPADAGDLSGGGTFNYGSLITLNATPFIGYSFINWTENGTQVNTNSIYSLTVDADRALVANFSRNINNSVIIQASALPAVGGIVSGSQTYGIGTYATLNATSNAGYIFTNWTEGGVILSTNPSYSFTVKSNRVLLANFIFTVGIEDINSKQIRMYPNPSHDILYFEFPTEEKTEINIFNNSGQLVLTSFEKTINISDLPVGFYFVKVEEQAFKLVKR